MTQALHMASFQLYHELFSAHKLFTSHDLCDVRSLESLTMLPYTALLIHTEGRMHCVWLAMLTLFILYGDIFSDYDLITDHELHEACTYKFYLLIYAFLKKTIENI